MSHDPRGNISGGRKFFSTIDDSEFTLTSLIESIQPDPWINPLGNRPYRCTGVALNVGISILELTHPNSFSKIIVFASGVCTIGPGLIVSIDMQDTIRNHLDIKNENLLYMKPATDYYDSLAKRAINNHTSIDVFACGVDQIGLLEMKSLSEETGGNLILSDTFASEVFTKSQALILDTEKIDYFNGSDIEISIILSDNLKISEKIGPGKFNFGDNLHTTYLASIDSNTTLAYFVEFPETITKNPNFYTIQFKTNYYHSSGTKRLRVTTAKFPVIGVDSPSKFIPYFDQETATVTIARIALRKLNSKPNTEVIRWIDRTLVKLVKVFASFLPDQAASFKLCKEFSLLPQFLYYMRRSPFLQTFNVSPDETSYYKSYLMRENITNSLLMIQPALLEYSFEAPESKPVLLDVLSLKNDVILLLDTYFVVLIWYGDVVTKWKNLGYQDNAEYSHFKELLGLPLEDAKMIVSSRFPAPKFVTTDYGKSQERILKARVNPSGTGNNMITESGNYLTDDASLKMFLDSMIEYVVKT